MNKTITLLLLVIAQHAFCQERKPLQGHVIAGEAVANGVYVINKTTGAEVKTDGKGNFTLPVKSGDALVVYSDRTDIREFAVNEFTFKEVPFVMAVNQKSYELNEVVIEQTLTSESLGLVPKNQLRRTVAERRLYTAGGMEVGVGLGFSISLDAIINAITGRIKMLRKALDTERKEFAIAEFNGLYTDTEIRDELHIPEEYIKGFIYYAVEDPDCRQALRSKNDELSKLQILRLAPIYIALLEEGGVSADTTPNPTLTTPANED